MICKICKQNFNFNKKLYDHIRNHEILKFFKNFHLSINAFNLICETMKKSTIINFLISLKTFVAYATLQKQIIEFAMFFETINSLKCSNFQSFALEIVSIRIKKKSFQCFTISSQSSIRNDVKMNVQKHSIVNSFFLIDTIKSTCKIAKKSTIVSIVKFSKFIFEKRIKFRIRIVYLFSKLKASRLNFSLNILITISKTMKNSSIQKIAHIQTKCKQCEQNFDFNRKFFEHINEHKILKFVKNLFFLINTVKSICETMKKSTIASSFFSQKSSNFFATLKKFVTNTRIFLQFVSSKNSNFSITKSTISSKRVKNISFQQIVCVRICKRCKQNFNFNNKFHEHVREHHVRKFVKNLNFRVFASKHTYNMKKKINIYLFVCFVRFVYSFCNIKKSKILIFNNFRISHRINAFAFLDCDIQNQFKIDKKRNCRLFVHFFHLFHRLIQFENIKNFTFKISI